MCRRGRTGSDQRGTFLYLIPVCNPPLRGRKALSHIPQGYFSRPIHPSCHSAQSSDTLLLTVPFDLGRLMPAPMLAKPSSSIPTVLISYRNDSLKAIQWMISISQAFKFQLTTPAFTRRLDRSSPAMTDFIRVKC